jgi:two-component system, sensor histidine kinase and response regulator
MPEMDGLQATAVIRELEAASGGHTPIIALTARANTVDRQLCLDAGMDGYIAKPFRSAELFATIDKLVASPGSVSSGAGNALETSAAAQGGTEGSPPAAPSGERPPIDLPALRERVEGDNELLAEMIDLFLNTAPRLLADIETAVTTRDATLLRLTAHALKGALLNMSAAPAAEAALRLEKIGQENQMHMANNACGTLLEEFARLQTVLNHYVSEVSA